MSATTPPPALPRSPPPEPKPVQPRGAWGARGKSQEQLRLLGALRGDGVLIWTGGEVPVTYELDLFTRGAARTACGSLEGDCSALVLADPDGMALPMSARLRLDDGVELVIALVGVDATSGEFDAADPSKADYLVSRLSESSAG